MSRIIQPPAEVFTQPAAVTRSETELRYERYVVPTAKRTLTLVRGEGCRVWDDRGRRYLDLGGGVAVSSLGHAPAPVRAALNRQAAELIHCSNLYYNEPAGRLAEKLVNLTGPGKVFFCNSGAEANEALIKLARKHGHAQGRYEIITAQNSFHGRTMATLTATGQEKIKHGFEPLLPGFIHVPFNDLAAVEAAITPNTAAILVEGIQGEGGVYTATPDYLLGLRQLADDRGLLLMMDAVQCGCFRTGRWQSYQRILEGVPGGQDFAPDAIAMAKSLGAGYPLGAAWIRAPYADVLGPGTHGTTYGGSPLACAVGLAVLETIETEELDANIRRRGDELCAGLRALVGTRGISDVRGCGGLVGLVFAEADPAAIVARLAEAGLILIPAANRTVRFLPPLNVSAEEIAEALQIVETALEYQGYAPR
jgi:acetylornithine aminotransferase/acetylornithine/N-succinyldiaminopimelate aminotransferase